MKRTYLKLIALLCAVMMLSAMVACKQTTPEAAGTGTTETTEPAEKTEAASDEPVSITVMHYMGEQSKRTALDNIVAAFETQYPNIDVNVEQVDSDDYLTVYQTRINAGDAPDVFFGSPRDMVEYCDAGLFMDLTGEEFLKDINASVLEETEVNGKLYGVPIDIQIKAVFYNKTMFEKYNLTAPTTATEMANVLDTFTKEGILPFMHCYGFAYGAYQEFDTIATPVCAAENDGTMFMDSQNGTANLSDNATALKVAETWSKVCSYQDDGDLTMDQSTAVERFAAGTRPMFIDGGWIYADTVAASEDEFDFFPYPWSENADENKLEVALDDCFIVSNSTEHKDAVFTFLSYIMSKEAADIWMNDAKLLSSSNNADASDKDPYVQRIKSYVDSGNVVAKAGLMDYTAAYIDAYISVMQTYCVNGVDDPAGLLSALDKEIALCN